MREKQSFFSEQINPIVLLIDHEVELLLLEPQNAGMEFERMRKKKKGEEFFSSFILNSKRAQKNARFYLKSRWPFKQLIMLSSSLLACLELQKVT